MAGHSKFQNIKFRKERQDQRKSNLFDKIVRQIMLAIISGGPDPKSNFRLKSALQKARTENLPKERIEKQFKKAADKKTGSNFLEEHFEAFIGGGAGIIIEALTDNKNRTVCEIKTLFNRFGASLTNAGCVSHMFDHRGIIQYPISVASADQILETAAEAGASDTISENDVHCIYTEIQDFGKVLDFMTNKYGEPSVSHIGWVPKEYVILDDKKVAKAAIKFVQDLEDLDDVQHVFVNYEISDKVYEELKNE